MSTQLHSFYESFHAATARLSSRSRDHVTFKAENIHSLVLYRKSLLSPAPDPVIHEGRLCVRPTFTSLAPSSTISCVLVISSTPGWCRPHHALCSLLSLLRPSESPLYRGESETRRHTLTFLRSYQAGKRQSWDVNPDISNSKAKGL